MRIRRIAVLIAVSAGMLTAVETAPARGEEGMTRVALRMAYQREVDAQRQYVAFATRADLEGYCGVADLFDALVQAEQVHARIHALRLEQMDETAVAAPTEFEVGTTAQNLTAAYETEMLERRTVYARFAEFARAEAMYDVVAGFGYAGGAEATHAAALAAAYYDLAAMSADHTYYLCTGCGRLRIEPSTAGCDCGAWPPRAVAPRLRDTPAAPVPVGPVAAR